MTEADRKRLIAILGMLGSNAVGERDNAARLAEEFRRKHGLSWADLLAATPSAPQPAPSPPSPPKPPEWAQAPPPPKPWEPRPPAGSPLRLWLRDKQWVPLAWAIGGSAAIFLVIAAAAALLPAPASQLPTGRAAVAQESEASFRARRGEILAGRHCTLAEQQEMPNLCFRGRGGRP
jgi:hypothetical protein